ncbi:MAG: hypothetical protein U1E63_01570 [Burkholderiales bacterium]
MLGIGLGYAALGVVLNALDVPFTQEIVLLVSVVLIGVLLRQVGISAAVAVAAVVIFLFRATPGVGQGYSYWAIDKLGFDQVLGLLAQVGSILGLVGLIVFRRTIVERPVSFTLFWVVIAGAVLYLPNIGLFYMQEWLGIGAHARFRRHDDLGTARATHHGADADPHRAQRLQGQRRRCSRSWLPG